MRWCKKNTLMKGLTDLGHTIVHNVDEFELGNVIAVHQVPGGVFVTWLYELRDGRFMLRRMAEDWSVVDVILVEDPVPVRSVEACSGELPGRG